MQTLTARGSRGAPDPLPSPPETRADAKNFSAAKIWLLWAPYFRRRSNHHAVYITLSTRVALGPRLFGGNHTKPTERWPSAETPGVAIGFARNAKLS